MQRFSTISFALNKKQKSWHVYSPMHSIPAPFKTPLWTSIRQAISPLVHVTTLEAVFLTLVLVLEFLARFRWMGRCHKQQPLKKKKKARRGQQILPRVQRLFRKKITRWMLNIVCHSVCTQFLLPVSPNSMILPLARDKG